MYKAELKQSQEQKNKKQNQNQKRICYKKAKKCLGLSITLKGNKFQMRIHKIVENIRETAGPGNRFCLWLQGCRGKCINCCNPETHNASSGFDATASGLLRVILDSTCDGLTISGGEPLDQGEPLMGVLALLKQQRPNINIILYTGYDIHRNDGRWHKLLLDKIDIIIHGPYDYTKPDKRKWIGSTNQKVIFNNESFEKLLTPWPVDPENAEIIISDNIDLVGNYKISKEFL